MARTDLRKHAPLAVEQARRLWNDGKTYREIAALLGLTKGQVAGLASRNRFPPRGRPRPIRLPKEAA